MDNSAPHRLHRLVMEFVRTAGLLHPDRLLPGDPISLSQAFAVHELDTDPPLSQRELAGRLGLEKSTVSRLVGELARRGLLVREPDPANRRTRRLRLTEPGRALHARMAGAFHQQYVAWIAAMSPDERRALLVGMAALVRAVHDHPPGRLHPTTESHSSRGVEGTAR